MAEIQIEPQAYIELAKKDKQMARAIQLCGPIHREGQFSLFPALVDNLIAQVISKEAASSISAKIRVLYPNCQASQLAVADPLQLRQLGMSWKKANWIIQAAQQFVAQDINEEELKGLSDEEAIQKLIQLDGVGRWTAEMLLIFSLNRPNVVSYGDYGIRKGIQLLYHHKTLNKKQFDRYRKRYAPYGTAASLILWQIASQNLSIQKTENRENKMSKIECKLADEQMLNQIADMAKGIWHEYYESILGLDQVNYMVSHFQNFEAMQKQVQQEGYQYYLLLLDDKPCGYAAWTVSATSLFLSKLYLQKWARGQGVASAVINHVKQESNNHGHVVWLTVNRYNEHTIDIYKKKGFVVIREEKNSIGDGYFMDDYIMQWQGQ